MRGRERTMRRVRSSTTTAVRTPRRLRSLWRLRVGAVAGLGLATTLALLPNAPAFGAGRHHQRADPPLQAANVASLARGGKPVLSNQPADYIPATLGGKKVVIDPRSTVGHTDPSCMSPADAPVVNPLDSPSEALEDVTAGLWDCPAGSPVGTGFGVTLDAVKAAPTTAKLSKESLYAPPFAADPGSVKAATVKASAHPADPRSHGKSVKYFTFRSTVPAGAPGVPAGTVVEVASAEPHAHLLVSATTPSGINPVPSLAAMLKAGAGKGQRAG
jgi:hypothetical protein